MRFVRLTGSLLFVGALGFLLIGTGCNRDKKNDAQAKSDSKSEKADGKSETTHEGWWCQDHGVPEEDCSICMSAASAKKKYKDAGDWCEIHSRAKSQCFKCDPSLYEKVFVPIHVAKTGKKPERPPESEFIDETKKKDARS